MPSPLNQAQTRRYLSALRRGLPPQSAAELVGVPWKLVQEALDRGQIALDRGQINPGEPNLSQDADVRLYLDTRQAIAAWEEEMLSIVASGDPQRWRAAAWLLTRRLPHWSPQTAPAQQPLPPLGLLSKKDAARILKKYENARYEDNA